MLNPVRHIEIKGIGLMSIPERQKATLAKCEELGIRTGTIVVINEGEFRVNYNRDSLRRMIKASL
jgi:hypothetical protein